MRTSKSSSGSTSKKASGNFRPRPDYFYDANGPDFGYSSNTLPHNLELVYELTHGTARADAFLEYEKRWFEWLSYDALPEPDGGWVLNRAIEDKSTRSSTN